MNKIQNLYQTIQDDEKVIQGLEDEIKLLHHKLSHAQGVKRCHEEALKRAQTEFYPECEPMFQKKDLYSQNVVQEVYEYINKDIPTDLPEEYHNHKMTRLTIDNYQELVSEGDKLYILSDLIETDREVFTVKEVEVALDHDQPFKLKETDQWAEIYWSEDEIYLLEEE